MIARVTSMKKIVVPPNSEVRVAGQLDVNLRSDYCIVPVNEMYLEVPSALLTPVTNIILSRKEKYWLLLLKLRGNC